ncbi:hypothetical protein [Undibacterium sp.]|uniref:hypothetical protein n=1 Tax=Undibacterium sp. TaxID=1914977 RepID=UPI0025F7B9C6|nr:hypothetical protein [Undibacterium sp.]
MKAGFAYLVLVMVLVGCGNNENAATPATALAAPAPVNQQVKAALLQPASNSIGVSRSQVLKHMEQIIKKRDEAPLASGEQREMIRLTDLFSLELIGQPSALRKVDLNIGLVGDVDASKDNLQLAMLTMFNVMPEWTGDKDSFIKWFNKTIPVLLSEATKTKLSAERSIIRNDKKITATFIGQLSLLFISVEPKS